MFDLLQLKDEKIFQTLHYLFKHFGWKDALDVLVTGLYETSYSYLIEEHTGSSPKIKNGGPILFDVRNPTVNFIGREQQLNELHDYMQQSAKKIGNDAKKLVIIHKTSAVTGLGGIGKTQLALRYIQLYRQHYDNNIVWINAESDATFKKSFIDLAENILKINLKNANGAEKELPIIVRDVYAHFSKVKCLFVFDNADECLKDEFYPNGQHQIYILITSRYQKWGQINVFHLGNFSPEEASCFIQITLKNKTFDNNEQMAHLAETLHFFPLALKQATAYINETSEINKNIGAAYSIDDYIKEYNEGKEELLSYKFHSDYGKKYFQTTFTTWKITIDKLNENTSDKNMVQSLKAGNMAIYILDCISYFGHEQIDMQMFVQPENEVEIGVAIQLLKDYSLVTQMEKNGLLNVHPLIQAVTQLNIKQKKAEKETLTTVYKLVVTYFEKLEHLQDYFKLKILLPHSEKLLQEMKHWVIKNPSQQKHIEQEGIQNLLIKMSEAYSNIGQERQNISVLEQLLSIKVEQYGQYHYEVAIVLGNLGNAYRNLRQPEKSKTLLEKALVISEKHYGPDHYGAAATLASLGNAYGELGQPEKKITLLEKALEIEEKHYGPDHYEVATVLANLGNAYRDLGQLEKSKTLLKKALAIHEKHYGPDHYEVARILVNLGIAYRDLRQPEKGKTLLEKALEIKQKHYGPNHYEVAKVLLNLGNAYGDLGQPEKQKTLLEKALEINEKHYGPNHYEVAIVLANLGNAYEDLGQLEKQKTLVEKALEINEKHYGPDHYEVATVLLNLGDAYRALGQSEKGKSLLEKALEIKEKHYGPDHYEVAKALVNLGIVYGNLGQPEKQKPLLDKALEIIEKDVPDRYEVAIVLVNLGNAYGTLGQPEKRKTLLEKALEIKLKHYGPDHYEVAQTLVHLSEAYRTLGQPEKQKTLLEKALPVLEKHYGPDHYEVAKTVTLLLSTYDDFSHTVKEKSILQKAFSFIKKKKKKVH